MKRLDRFILTSFAGPFIAILAVVIFALMMQFLWLYIDELVGKGLSLSVILEFLFWGGCTILPLALPLTTLLASMMTIGQMAENNELLAIKSSGISVIRVFLPIFVVSIGVSIAAFYSVNNLVPVAFNKIYTMRDDIKNTKDEIKIPSGIFYDGIDGYTLRVNHRNPRTGMMYGVMVYDHTENKGNTSVIVADSALMKMSKNKDYLTFNIYSGINYKESNKKSYRDTSLQLQRVEFSHEGIIIPLENYTFQGTGDARFGDQIKSMNLRRQRVVRDSLIQLRDSVITAHMSEIMTIGRPTSHMAQIDTAYSKREITTEFHPEGFMQWKDLSQESQAYTAAISTARQIKATVENYQMDSIKYTKILRLAQVEILRKYSQALACLILFLIGAPLGAIIKKGGLGTSAIVSVLLFVLYWVIDLTGTKLAKDGSTSSYIGAFISAAAMVPIGIFLTWKATHDASPLNADMFKDYWRKLKRKIRSFFHKTRIVYMGTPEFAVAPLDALVKAGYEVVGVVTVADKPSGRGLKLSESPVKQYAVSHNIPVLQPEKLKDPAFLKALSDWKADLFVVVGFRMLPEAVWSMPKLGTFNLHAALLPQYRGAAPINWAVINGEHQTGVTTFMIDARIDTGGIMLRQEHPIGPADTAGDVHDALMGIGADLVVQTVKGILENDIVLRTQRSFIQGAEMLWPAPKLTRELCYIDWNDSTTTIYNLIRGLSPFPTAYTELVPCHSERSEGISDSVISSEVEKSVEPSFHGSTVESLSLKIFFAEPLTSLEVGSAAEGCHGQTASAVAPTPAVDSVAVLPLTWPRVATGSATTPSSASTTSVPAPGTVATDGKTFFAIATADGWLSLKDVQLAGKKRMDIKAFLAGFRDAGSYRAVCGTSRAELDKVKPIDDD